MPIEGELVVTLACSGAQVRSVDVRSTRPLVASRILVGKSAANAAATVPLLFALCGGAQGAAAACALAAAGAAGFEPSTPARDAGVVAEALQESFWHLLIDWPNAVGSAPQITPVTAARHLIAASARTPDGRVLLGDAAAMRTLALRLDALAAQSIFGRPAAEWLAQDSVDALRVWTASTATLPARLLADVLAEGAALGRSDIAPMPAATRDALLSYIAPALAQNDEFAHAPTWAGVPVETGALARHPAHPLVAACTAAYGNGVATRIVARLVEVGMLLGELAGADPGAAAPPRAQSIPLAGDAGLGAIVTARGLLLHRVEVRDERVVDYRIVAPTEWNFHPDGALARGLTGVAAHDRAALLRAARLCVHTLDPCVASRVETRHA